MLTHEDDFAELNDLCRQLDEAEQFDGAKIIEAMLAATCFVVAVIYAIWL